VLLLEKESELFDKRILITPGESPRGATVFRDLVTDPPATETEFILLWKLYIVSLIAREMRKYDINRKEASSVYRVLENENLLEAQSSLAALLRRVQQTTKKLIQSVTIEGFIAMDPSTGTPLACGKISLREPVGEERERGSLSVDNLFSLLSKALKDENFEVWVLLDRLDVAFIDNHELEANALRALMRVYNDVKGFDNISIKIFIREDIWKRITQGGFREASHIIRFVLLDWSPPSLLNLLMRRILSNDIIANVFEIDKLAVLQNAMQQDALFSRMFPAQVEQGPQKALTFKWMITRCADGTRKTAPRELIHLLNCLREQEVRRLEQGGMVPPGDQLFDRSVFKQALPTRLIPLSQVCLNVVLRPE